MDIFRQLITDPMFVARELADPAYVAKFQKFCGVESEKPETCDQETQTRSTPSSDSDSSDQDEQTENSEPAKHSCDGVGRTSQVHYRTNAGQVSDSLECNNNSYQATQSETNLNQEHNNIKSKKVKKTTVTKKGYHIIEPTSRVHSKGSSIFDCNGLSYEAMNGNAPGAGCPSNAQVKPAVQIKYKSLLYLAHFGAFLGNEEFYLTFFPFCIWNLDFLVVRQVAMLWAMVMYLGQATKDYLHWPRPSCPPVIRLETNYIQEYSMPSTHAMAGTAIPLYLAYLAVERYEVPIPIAATVALLWYTITCFSRLYLGVHTILDLVAGTLYSVVIFVTFLRYVEDYDLYQQTHPFAAPVIIVMALALCTVCYPTTHKNNSKGDAVQIVAALTGTALAAWLGYQLDLMHEPEATRPYSIEVPTLAWIGLALLRFITGLMIVAVIYVFVRWSSIHFFSYLYGLEKPDKTVPNVMTAYKFTTYSLVGLAISFAVPLIHAYFGIERPSLFYEVL